MEFHKEYVFKVAQEILAVDSPTGYTIQAINTVEKMAKELGYEFSRTNKGNGIIDINGKTDKTIALCAHVDTNGLMVRSIKGDGKLAFTMLGSPTLATFDGEYCKVHTREGKVYTGTVLSTSPAAHVYKDATNKERDEKNMEIRLDEVVKTKADVEALGITTGDIIAFDTKTVVTPSGFIKSRFLDDKLSVALILGLLKYWKDANIIPEVNVKFMVSTYEEVGHGMAYIPEGIDEIIAVDMGCIGEDLACTEYDVSICAKDSSGPYDYGITSKLIELAKSNELSYAIDIYPYYGSDVSAALKGGNDVKGGLIGPGVHASHGMERSHWSGIENTMKLLNLYLTNA